MPKEAHIAVRIEPGMLKNLKRISEKEDRSVSWLIRKAIEKLIQGKEQKRGH